MKIYKGKTVLVTGHTGFKGAWLTLWLLELGAKVVGVSLKPRTQRDLFVKAGLKNRVTHIQADIRDPGLLEKVFKRHNPVFAFHLAAQPLVLESYKNPLATFDTNVMGTVRFLEAIRHTPSVRSALVITSDKCYENREYCRPFCEQDPLGGHDPYSASKGAAEIVVGSWRRSFTRKGLGMASVRAGNVIGGGDFAPHRIVPDCIKALEKGSPIAIRNPASIRPWQHVLEPLSGYLTLAARLFKEPSFAGAWNFGPKPKNAVPVKVLAELIIREFGSGNMVTPGKKGPHEAGYLKLDASKAAKLLGWKPRLDIKSTVKWTVREYKTLDIRETVLDHIEKYTVLMEKDS